MCPRSIVEMPSSQALPGYLITAPPPLCVPDVIGALAVWIQNQKKKEKSRWCACLTKALTLTPESLRFQGSQQFGINMCMENGQNMRGGLTARRTQPFLSMPHALAPCARQPGSRPRWKVLLFSPKRTLHEPRHALREPLHFSILAAHDTLVWEHWTARTKNNINRGPQS